MVTFSVVVLDPWCKCSCALLVAGEDLTVGPFGGEGAVESFDLSVLPRAVRTNELLNSAQRCADILQVGGVAVRKRVVGQDPLDAADAFAGEVRGCALQEGGAGRALFIGQDLAVAILVRSSTNEWT